MHKFELTDRVENGLRAWSAALLLLAVFGIASGVILALSYEATLAGARASVQALEQGAASRWLLAAHRWTSPVLILLSAAQVAAMLWIGAFRPPHHWRWLAAVAFLVGSILLQITGNLLPMDRHGVQTTVIEASILGSVPGAGPLLQSLVLAGQRFNQDTLRYWMIAHYALFALLLFQGTGYWKSLIERPRRPVKYLSWTPIPILFVAALALLFQAPLGRPATPADFNTFDTGPNWYTWPGHALLRFFDSISTGLGWVGAVLLPFLLLAGMLLLPLFGRALSLVWIRATTVGLAVVTLAVTLLYGGPPPPILSRQEPAPGQRIDAAPTPPSPIDETLAQRGKALFSKNGCMSCHSIDGSAKRTGPDLTRVYEKQPRPEWYMRFIKNPTSIKPNTTMPAFSELSEPELRALAEYLRRPK